MPLLRQSASEWSADRAPRLGAAISYYTVFSLAPLLLISIAVAGFVVGGDTARDAVIDSLGGLIGQDGGKAIEGMVDNAARNRGTGVVATAIGTLMLLVGASGVFVELQGALNTVWGVEAAGSGGIRGFVRDRLASFAMVVAIGFLLLVSMVITAVLAVLSEWMTTALPGSGALWQVVNQVVSLAITACLFAMVFKFVPDLELGWRDVAVGAVFTAVLFTIGKLLIGLYLGRGTTTSVFGAAGSLAVLFVWVYYSAQILLFGAEFTQVWATKYGSLRQRATPAPKRGATVVGKSPPATPERRTGVPPDSPPTL